MAPDSSAADQALAIAAQGGSREAFGHLASRHYRAVHACLLTLLDNRSDAEDLTQETFLRAFRKIRSYNPRQPFRPWIFSIARRVAIAHWRRRRSTDPLDDSVAHPPAAAPPSGHDAVVLWSLARRHLKPDEFTALWLHYREDLPVADIARALRKTRNHAKVILHRARTRLRSHLEPEAWRPAGLPPPLTSPTP